VSEKERYELRQLIVSKFVASVQKINWGREFKYAKILSERYPELEFWQKFHVTVKPKSLSFFLKGAGAKLLIEARNGKGFQTTEVETYALKQEKIGDDAKIQKKAKTVLEFLKYGKEI
jgi:hypothetical protein